MTQPSNNYTPAQRLAAIRELYKTIPRINCLGKCWPACTDIDMSITERETIRRRYGYNIHKQERGYTVGEWSGAFRDEPKPCQALDRITHQCRVYEDRPLVCRVWGTTKALPCEFGCTPDRWLTYQEYLALDLEVRRIGGHLKQTEEERAATVEMMFTTQGKQALEALMLQVMEHEHKWWQMYFRNHPENRPDGWEEENGERETQAPNTATERGRQQEEGETGTDPVRGRSGTGRG